ncbi:hypothetical protein Pla22_35160 [Rubripirellula amarantea]|uniref:Uncharacterized protein n=1 Tax=Rubripirellula amarantea TaxID=2527999 RepID=A0A5C5WLB5_9BACT|nr:hypothetical protein [Rubripirellula amarantea]TWT50773.1 hypothetical protein Pla22_35160 [Rubripirellula amarantea]
MKTINHMVSLSMWTIACCSLLSIVLGSVRAGDGNGQVSRNNAGLAQTSFISSYLAQNQDAETLAIQLPNWITMHFDNAVDAATHAETLQKFGCEIKKAEHATHIDVTYRLPLWTDIPMHNHAAAEQWADWLSKSGFDVSHAHLDAEFTQGPEPVQLRLVQWRQMHGDGSAEEKQYIAMLQRLGVEVQVDQHGDHSDIAFRAPTWRAVHLNDHASADELVQWLSKNGFETHHQH